MSINIRELENKLNLAKSTIESLPEKLPTKEVITEYMEDPKKDENIVDINNLKQDFIEARTTLKGIISKGEEILQSVSMLDVSDLKPSQIQAVAALQSAIGSNVKLMLDIYKQMQDVYKNNNKKSPINTAENQKIQQNNIFVGNSRELLQELTKLQ